METLINWLHLVAAVVWVGGLLFILLALQPGQAQMMEAAKRFRPFMLAAMAFIVGTGVWQLIQLGGFKAVPTLFHVKILLALIMVVASLLGAFYFLPRAATEPGTPDKAATGFVWTTIVTVLLGLVILLILAQLGWV